ncbi:MAG: DUF58 domain-containing protein [Clostridia bacterium]|nr:DUF58 domain-containing protein [Clostridia bacterium]
MTGRRILYLAGVAGAVGFYLMYQKWFSWIVLMVVLFLPWLSLLLSLRPMFTFRAKLEAPEKVSMHEHAVVCFNIEGARVHPPVVNKMRVVKPITGEVWVLQAGNSLSNHCGTYMIRAEKVFVYDYMGLFRRRIRKKFGCVIRVMPEPVPMEVPADLNRLVTRAWRPKAGGGYAENHEIRPYQPGDTMNLIHWKLSAKVDSLMLREPMEPEPMRIFLKMDLCGTPEVLDRKFGRLLWMGNWLLERNVSFTVLAMTGNGIQSWFVSPAVTMDVCLRELLASPSSSGKGSVMERKLRAAWQIDIGGEPDEN